MMMMRPVHHGTYALVLLLIGKLKPQFFFLKTELK